MSQITKNGYLDILLDKRIEDGILDSIHKANHHQLGVLLNGGYKFRYYNELNNQETLKSEIQIRIRESKLNQLL